LLDQYLNIKICDFGWCAENCAVKRTTFCGTYEYMAPEMIFRSEYDYRVDVWAVGVLLYELLHGTAPFKGKSIEEVQESMLKGCYEINPKLSDSVKHLIEQILQFKPEERLSLEAISQHPWMKEMEEVVKEYMKQ
jgi:serine/threonine protein kinase